MLILFGIVGLVLLVGALIVLNFGRGARVSERRSSLSN